jgi:hypothetical protein
MPLTPMRDHQFGSNHRIVTPHRNYNTVFPSLVTTDTDLADIDPTTDLKAFRGSDVDDGIAWRANDEGNMLALGFFGTGSDNATAKGRILEARVVPPFGISDDAELLLPRVLVEFTITLGTKVGVAGAGVTDSMRFADTITIDADYTLPTVGVQVVNRPNDVAAMYLDLAGAPTFGVQLECNESATGINAMGWSL